MPDGGIQGTAKERDLPVRLVEEDEIAALLRACENTTRFPIRNKAIVLLACRAGLTCMEIAELKRLHVLTDDGLQGEWIDLHKRPRSADAPRTYLMPRRIPMPRGGDLWQAINKVLGEIPAVPEDPLVISQRAKDGGGATLTPGATHLREMRPSSIACLFLRLIEAAGIGDVSASALRRTFIVEESSKILRSGGSLREVQRVSGQRSLDTLQRYLEIEEERRQRATQAQDMTRWRTPDLFDDRHP